MEKYGKWTIVGKSTKKNHKTYMPCECECGQTRLVCFQSLRRGASTSCGCLKNKKLGERSKRLVKNVDGERFGRLIVVRRDYEEQKKRKSKSAHWVCKCDCGKTVIVAGSSLLRKKGTKSCGCWAKELSASRIAKMNQKPHGVASFNSTFYHYKYNAARRNLSFKLSKDEFKELISKNCRYCDGEPQNKYKNRQPTGDLIYNGIDRLDSDKGYEQMNCVSCCKICNRAKSRMSVTDFLAWIQRLIQHSAKSLTIIPV